MSSLQQLPSISKLLASSNHQKSDVYAHHIHSFRNVWDRTEPISKQNPKNLAAVSRVHWGSKFLRKSFRVALYKWWGLSMLRVMADEIHIAYLRIQARKR